MTFDGPDTAVREVGGAAVAADGTGGVVYTKVEEGVPHVFVARYLNGVWLSPVRVDALPWDASQPRIAAGEKGRLLVVWVSQIGTVHGKIRRALYSAELDPGSATFDPPLIVDPNVAAGEAVDPSLAGTAAGRAIVAYRVITYSFGPSEPFQPAIQLKPGDVMAEVRVARYQGSRWTRLGPINRNPDASMPAPTAANAPQVGVALDGGAVVAWQERDQSSVARIWARRVFGASLGPTLPASPSTWQGKPVATDADGLAVAVSPLGMAEVLARVPEPAGGGAQLFSNQLPTAVAEGAGVFAGAQEVGGGPLPGPVGEPAVAVSEQGKSGGARVAVAAGGALHATAFGAAPAPLDPSPPPAPSAGAEVGVGQSSTGGTVTAWETVGSDGLPAVAVRQEPASGGVQTGVLSGAAAGKVSDLHLASDTRGDALIGFLQTAAATQQVVVEAVSAPVATFSLSVPKHWVRPRKALLSWQAAPAASAVSYTVIVAGEAVATVAGRKLRLPAGVLGNGVSAVRILARDTQGQAIATAVGRLKVDARAPQAAVSTRGQRGSVQVRVTDSESGVAAGHTTCSFGGGTPRQRQATSFRYVYPKPGHYVIQVHTRDRAGNRANLRLPVVVR